MGMSGYAVLESAERIKGVRSVKSFTKMLGETYACTCIYPNPTKLSHPAWAHSSVTELLAGFQNLPTKASKRRGLTFSAWLQRTEYK